jgi:hypothetical protein
MLRSTRCAPEKQAVIGVTDPEQLSMLYLSLTKLKSA